MMVTGDDPTAHQLRLALVLAEELHFGRAAARLYVTQPSLSQQIRSLEQRLGVTLFTRTSRRVEPTGEGRMLFPLLRRSLEANDELRRAAAALTRDRTRLQLGVCESFAALQPTRGVIADVGREHAWLGPDVHVSDSFTEQLEMLRTGQVDAAFTYLPVPDDLHVEVLATEPRLLCVAAGDPLARRSSVRLTDLSDRDMLSIAPESFPAGRCFWTVDPRPDGSTPRVLGTPVRRFESLLSTISVSSAISFVPASAAELYPRPDVVYRPVDDLTRCTFGVVWPSGAEEHKITALREVCARRSPEPSPWAGAVGGRPDS